MVLVLAAMASLHTGRHWRLDGTDGCGMALAAMASLHTEQHGVVEDTGTGSDGIAAYWTARHGGGAACLMAAKQKRGWTLRPSPFLVVALPGLEPGNAAPKTVVLPLHYKAILVSTERLPAQIAVQNYCFFLICNAFDVFFSLFLAGNHFTMSRK